MRKELAYAFAAIFGGVILLTSVTGFADGQINPDSVLLPAMTPALSAG